MRLRRGAAWGCAGAQHGAAQGRSVGLRMVAASGCASVQRGAAQVRSVGLRIGAAPGRAWGRVGLRRGAGWGRAWSRHAAWGCPGAQQRGAALGRSSVALRKGAA